MSYESAVLATANLVSYWKLGETVGSTSCADSFGSNTMTPANVTLGSTARLSGDAATSASFNGTSSILSLANNTPFNWEYSQPWTIEFVIEPNSPRTGSFGQMPVFSRMLGASPYRGFEAGVVYNDYSNSKTTLYMFVVSNFSTALLQIDGTIDLANGSIWHCAISYDGSQTYQGVSLWVNGVADTQHIIAHNLVSATIINTVIPRIGARAGVAPWATGNIQDVAVYNAVVPYQSIRAHYLLSVASTFAPPADLTQPVPIIIDTDICSDIDDCMDLGLARLFGARGNSNLLAVVTDSANVYSAPAASSIMAYYGVASTPVYAWKGSTPSGAGATSVYTSQLSSRFEGGATRSSYTDSTTGYRTILHNVATANSVVIIMTGFATAMAALMASPSDGIDSRTGLALIAATVNRLVVVGGIMPTSGGTAEFNLAQDPANFNYLFANWPAAVPIVVAGIELVHTTGPYTVVTAPPSTADPLLHPVKYAFNLWAPTDNDPPGAAGYRAAWGQMGVLYAVGGLGTNFQFLGACGTETVNATTGVNAWTGSTVGGVSYLGFLASASTIQTEIENQIGISPPVAAYTRSLCVIGSGVY